MAVPPELSWLRDEVGLRPPAIARVLGIDPAAFARWTGGGWSPAPGDVPLVPALAGVHAQVCARYRDERARRQWWIAGQRPLGWLSPAEVLRRGKLGELLLLVAALSREECDGDA